MRYAEQAARKSAASDLAAPAQDGATESIPKFVEK
jgi:hypothetical protein